MHKTFPQSCDADHSLHPLANERDAPDGAEPYMRTFPHRGVRNRILCFQDRLRSLENFRVELVLIPCSIWAAKCLWTPPSNFAAFPAGWHVAMELLPEEWMWGLWAAVAGATKSIGLLLSFSNRLIVSSTLFRCIGLGLSGTFWFLLGLSTMLGNSDSLNGPMQIVMAISAWWVLIRLPAIPGRVE